MLYVCSRNLVIFTSGTTSYANLIADYLDPGCGHIDYVFHRGHCILNGDLVVKDLRVLGGRELSGITIVDNSVLSFAPNLDNGIFVPMYSGESEDSELKTVTEFLLEM